MVMTPNYSYVFKFEADFIYQDSRIWMKKNWTSAFYLCGIYLVFIFGGQFWMRNRPKFELRAPLAVWNSALAIFSIIGAIRTASELVHVLRHFGLFYSICNQDYAEQDHVCAFWSWLFVLSKVLEMGDTVFIVLRKQPLIILHWYHHTSVLVWAWFGYAVPSGPARWIVFMNYGVHAVMYSYYALRAMSYRPPRYIPMVITSLQLTQMIVGCSICLWIFTHFQSMQNDQSLNCRISSSYVNVSIAILVSYFVLFAHFFYATYLSANALKGKHSYKKLVNADNTADKIKDK